MRKEFKCYARPASAPNQCISLQPNFFLINLLTWIIIEQDNAHNVSP